MTDRETFALCRRWQKRLRLMDWKVRFHLRRRDFFGNDHTRGQADYTANFRAANVYLLRPECHRDNEPPIEHTIVHELLHLALAALTESIERGTVGETVEEQAINALTEALTGLGGKGHW